MGTDAPEVTAEPTKLTGFETVSDNAVCFPALRPGTGDTAGIALSDLPATAVERLHFVTETLGYQTQVQKIDLSAQEEALVFVSSAGSQAFDQSWDLETWKSDWGEIARLAIIEMFEHFGHIPAEILSKRLQMILVRAAAQVAAAPGKPANIRSDLAADSTEVLSRENKHAGFFLTREVTLCHPRFDGSSSPPVVREVFVATDAAIVLPYDPLRDRVLLVEQFRMGPFGRGDPRPWMLEPVAGRVDPGEAPAVTARRECEEEAGLALHDLEHIASYYCSPGCSTEYFHCYLGLCNLPDLNPGQGGLPAEDEDIRTHVLPFDDAMKLISTGEADNGPLILSLIWLAQERSRLRSDA